jgi:hypothetical protein
MAKKTAPKPTLPTPQRLADLPGLGPIRLRALQKAGWESLDGLSKADPEALAKIPGITLIKAQQIVDYLAQFPNLPTKPVEPPDLPPPAPAEATKESKLTPLAVQVMRAVLDILIHLADTEIRPRLLRELALSAQLAQLVALSHAPLSKEIRIRLEGGLLGIQQQIRDALEADKWGKKAQADLIGALSPYNEVLTQILNP